MEEKILVTYASRNGATGEIAEQIGAVLRQADLMVDVLPVDGVHNPSAYRAVILGSAIYIGSWRKEAVKFLERHADSLAERPVWLFSSGPTGEGDPVALVEGKVLPDGLKPLVERIQPRELAVFHGNIDPQRINFLERAVIKNMKKPFGDFRDWDLIIVWASTVAAELQVAVEMQIGTSLPAAAELQPARPVF